MRPILVLALLSPGCALFGDLFQKPTVTLHDVEITEVSFTGVGANFIFAIDNPNPIGVDVARIDYKVILDGNRTVEGHGDQTMTLPARGSGTLRLPVKIDFQQLGGTVASLLTKKDIPYKVQVTLGFQSPAGVIDVPIESSGTFPVPQPPQVALRGASLSDLTLGGVQLNLDLGLHNPNAFAMPLGGLSWRAQVEGADVATGTSPSGQLPASGDQTVKLSMRIDFLRAGMAVAQALQSGQARVGIAGQLDLGAFQLPIHVSQTVPLR